jgi:hypothetical protein
VWSRKVLSSLEENPNPQSSFGFDLLILIAARVFASSGHFKWKLQLLPDMEVNAVWFYPPRFLVSYNLEFLYLQVC